MRHFAVPCPIAPLPPRVKLRPPPAALVPLTSRPLPGPPCALLARPVAVPRPRHVAHRAQRHRPAAARVPANAEVQRDHGPRRR